MRIICTLVALTLIGCNSSVRTICYMALNRPRYSVDPYPEKILVLSNYNAKDILLKKKKAAFLQLTDQLMDSVSVFFPDMPPGSFVVKHGYTDLYGKTDSMIKVYLNSEKCSHALLISYMNLDYQQSKVSMPGYRTTWYYLYSFIIFSFYDSDSLISEKAMRNESPQPNIGNVITSYPVILNDTARGFKLMKENLFEFLSQFFTGMKSYTRIIMLGTGFEKMDAALQKNDYTTALEEGLRLSKDPNKKTAASALYDCAVFMERLNKPAEAKKFLEQSVHTYSYYESSEMLKEYTRDKN